MTTDRPALLVTRTLPEAVEARAARDYAARLNPDDRTLDRATLLALAADADAILCCPADKLDADTIAALPARVRMLATFSVGTDHIDLAAAKARGIVVANTPDVLTDATADIALLLMLAATRRAGEGERMVRAGAWTGWTPTQLMGSQITGKRLGIVGMGRIGQAVARRAQAFGMSVHYHNRRELPAADAAGAIFHADLDGLLAVSDVLSLHCPATPDTVGLINAARIEKLPPGAVLVNTARGTVVDDAAVIAALRSGRLSAAGLDVFTNEPKLHPDYLTLDNAVLLPHLGSATVETRNAMGFRALDNLDALFAGQEPPHRVA